MQPRLGFLQHETEVVPSAQTHKIDKGGAHPREGSGTDLSAVDVQDLETCDCGQAEQALVSHSKRSLDIQSHQLCSYLSKLRQECVISLILKGEHLQLWQALKEHPSLVRREAG